MIIFWILLPAFLASVVLTGIHTYLGLHVLKRGVIFVDIALAQIAALGITIAMYYGFEAESTEAYFFALGFTAIASIFFAFVKSENIPQEALIGICFAVSSALVVLIASLEDFPHGTGHLSSVLSGNILYVTIGQVFKTAIIYSGLGIVHFLFRKRFLLVSMDPEKAKSQNFSVRFWDLFFYLSFATVITSSVQMGGILLVFSFLIIPASIASLLFHTLLHRLCAGWAIGVFVSFTAIVISHFYEWPTGPTMVVLFGATLILVAITKRFFLRQNGNRAHKNLST